MKEGEKKIDQREKSQWHQWQSLAFLKHLANDLLVAGENNKKKYVASYAICSAGLVYLKKEIRHTFN